MTQIAVSYFPKLPKINYTLNLSVTRWKWQITLPRTVLSNFSYKNFKISGNQAGVTGLTCGGDSGGPLVFFDSHEEHYIQVGIVSGGTCQSLTDPSIFSRIEDREILEFIKKQFWDNISTSSSKAIEKLMAENKELIMENEARKDEIDEIKAKNVKLENMILKSDEKINGLLKTIENMAVNEDLTNDVKLLKSAAEKDKV